MQNLPTVIENNSNAFEIYVPKEAKNRVASYMLFERLQQTQHKQAFNCTQAYADMTYIAVGLPSFISKEIADMMFSQSPTISIEDDKAQAEINTIVNNNNFGKLLWESSYSNSALGDDIITVGVVDDKIEIMGLDPVAWSPITDRLNKKKVVGHEFYFNFPIEDEKGNVIVYVWKKTYLPGSITNETFRYDALHNRLEKVSDNPLEIIGDGVTEELTVNDNEGNGILLPTHIPNFSVARELFGVSDYRDVVDIVKALNNRISQISNILDYHSAPDTMVPQGTLDEYQEYRVSKESHNKGTIFEVPITGNGGDSSVKKITWDPQLGNAFEEVKNLLEIFSSVAETDRETITTVTSGNTESGRALRLRLRKLIAKASRKSQTYVNAIQQIIAKALWLKGYSKISPQDIRVDIHDNIPTDEKEIAELVEIWLRNGLISEKSAIKKVHPDLSDDQIDEEADAIKNDSAEAIKNNPLLNNINENHTNDKEQNTKDGKKDKGNIK